MVRFHTVALVALGLGLAACAPAPHPPLVDPLPPGMDPHGPPDQLPPAPVEDLSACGGDAVLGLIGQDASTLPATGGWGAIRVIRPGMMITMDYSAARLNVSVDTSGRILAFRCG